ncbi:MAG: ribonuclease J [Chloroflexota bacterium]
MSSHRLRIIPLGGVGEIGKNMMVLECGPDMVIIDAGFMFPSEDMLGIDLLIPDFTYVLENKERVRGIVITHGHEDHIGALPYLAQSLSVPVYASKLTARLIQSSSKQKNARTKLDLREMSAGEKMSFGTMSVEFFPVCHSIPDAMGLIVQTPIGTVVHTGDFKLDHTPVIGEPTDLHRLALIGTRQVLLLMSDSTYAELPGYTPSEEVVEDSLDRIISGAPGRVIIATFSSLVSRLQQAMDIAAKYKRSVIVTGRSMENIVKVASDAGYLRIPPKTLSRYEQVQNHPHERIVVLTTGTQGEPTSALVRMANKEHQQIRIVPGDTVVMSATPIPGNEKTVSRTINNLFRLGANVIYGAASHAHVHGHGSQEELKTILNLVKPKYFVPIHGEYRHLARHALMAEQMGISKENVFLLEVGDVLELTGNSGKVVGKVPANDIVANGLVTGALDTKMLRDRRILSRDGIVVVSVALSPQTGKLAGPPEIVSKGFVDWRGNNELVAGAQRVVTTIASHRPLPKRKSTVEARIREALAKYLYDETHRRPVIMPLVTGLESDDKE